MWTKGYTWINKYLTEEDNVDEKQTNENKIPIFFIILQLCVHIIRFGQLTRKLNQGGKKSWIIKAKRSIVQVKLCVLKSRQQISNI